jgi:hypothetical protein
MAALARHPHAKRICIFVAGNDIRVGNDPELIAWEMDNLRDELLEKNVEIKYFNVVPFSDRS